MLRQVHIYSTYEKHTNIEIIIDVLNIDHYIYLYSI